MATSFTIDGYILSYPAKPFGIHTITLYNSAKAVAELFFKPDGTVLPNNEIVNGVIHLFYQFKDFYTVFDLILRVKPLKVVFNPPSTAVFCGLTTAQVIPV